MGERAEAYRVQLRGLKDWEPFLKKHSGLPGPRANLELVAAVVEEGDADRLWRLSASRDEFLALCGTAGLGRIALLEPETVMTWLRELSSDPRWRVREGVAIALQRLGRESMPKLMAEMRVWSRGDWYVQRAVVAGLCEPALLKNNRDVVEVLATLDQITRGLSLAAPSDRREPYLEKWIRSQDKDVAWVMKANLGKSRIEDLAKTLVSPAPKAKPAAKAKPKPKPKAAPRRKPTTRR